MHKLREKYKRKREGERDLNYRESSEVKGLVLYMDSHDLISGTAFGPENTARTDP